MKKKTSEKKLVKIIERLLNIFIVRSIIFDVLILLLGVFFIVNPYSGLRGCEIAFSVVLIVSGLMAIFDCTAKKIISLFNFSLIYGVSSLILGLLIILNPLSLANIVSIIFGLWITISGVLKISNSLNLKKHEEECWSVTFGIGFLTTVIGVLLIFNPFIQLYITQAVGIFVVIYAVLDITNSWLFRRRKNQIIDILK